MRRCPGFPTSSPTRSSPASSRRWPASWSIAAARSAGSFTPGWPSPRPVPPWSSSTADSGIPSRRRCWHCWTVRSGAFCAPPRMERWPGSLRLAGGPGAAVTVVRAAETYPGRPRVGDVIVGADDAALAGVLHAATARRDDGALVSTGGRVLSVVGTGPDLSAARSVAYQTIESIRLPGGHFRTDIGLAAAEGRIKVD